MCSSAGHAGHSCQLNSQCLEKQSNQKKMAIKVRMFIQASSQLLKSCKILKNDELLSTLYMTNLRITFTKSP